jgi:Phytanoyl-CoA dioxygenase (PhyH)
MDSGHAILQEVFERREMLRVADALDEAPIGRTKAGARHVLSVPVVRELAGDSRLLEIAASFVGAIPVPFRATLFDKSPASNWLVVWHQDTALPLRARVNDVSWGPWSVKAGVLYAHAPAPALATVLALRVHLDDSTAANGPLRLLPGTHLQGVLSDQAIERLSRNVTPVDCVAPSGGVIAMRPLTIHASSKASDGKRRRVLHIEYAASVHLGSGIELAVG